MPSPRRWSVLLVLLLSLSGCASLRRDQARRHTMWTVQDADNTVYLVGSVHVLPKRAHPLPRALEQAFEDSDQIVFEIDLSRYSEEQIAEAIESDARYPESDSLENHLSPDGMALLKAMLEAMGIDSEAAMRYRAWFLADVSMARYLHESGIRAEYGVDHHFYKRAKHSRKQIGGLELLRAQTNIYRDISDEDAEAYLVSTLMSLPSLRRTILRIADAWRSGRTDALDALLNAQVEKDPKMNLAMFGSRNRAWLPQIERMIAGNRNAMVIVGAGHLVGRDGIIQELRRRGHPVEQQ